MNNIYNARWFLRELTDRITAIVDEAKRITETNSLNIC